MTARAWVLSAGAGCCVVALVARETQSLRAVGLLCAIAGLILLVGGFAMGNRYQRREPPE